MMPATARATPLLSAFQRDVQDTRASAFFQALLTYVGCLIPVAVCLYLVDLQPIFEMKDIEFTYPDLLFTVVVVAVVGRALIRGFHPLQKSFFLPLLLLLLSTIISAIFAVDKVRAAAAVVQMVEFGLFAWCFSIITTPKHFLTIVHSILALFVFETFVGASQFIGGASMPTGTFMVHQEFAMYVSYAAAMSFALLIVETNKLRRIVYLLALLILLFGSLLGQERAPWVSFIFAGFGAIAYAGKRRKALLVAMVLTLVTAVTLVVSIPQLREVTISRLAESQNDTEATNSLLSRLALWGVAYQFFLSHPILGVGPKNYTSLIPHYLSQEEMMGAEKLDPHNIWIGMLAEQGVVGFAAYLTFCIGVLRVSTQLLRKTLPPMIRSLCMAYLAYHIFWIVMSYHYFSKATGHVHFMLIGLMLGLQRSLSSPEGSARVPLTAGAA